MQDRFTTISGWVLFAGIIALGSSIVTGEVFRGERPETMGYPIEGVEVEGAEGEAAKPIEFYLASADPAAGEQVFKKCAACHNADKGGPNALGPNLWGSVGKPHGHVPGFAYSEALKKVPGVWDWKSLDAWLANPKKYAPGTKMTFAGLSKPEDRANVIAFLNARSDSPQPMPAAPAEAADDATAKPGSGTNDGAQKAENEPVLNEQQAGTNAKNVGGPGAPKVAGTAENDKN